MTTPAWIDLDGVANMRDLGGIPTTDGGAIQPGRLLRSDNLQDLTTADIEQLRDRGVSDIIDLRTDVEVHLTGDGPLKSTDVTHHHLSLFRDNPNIDSTLKDALVLPWHDRVDEQRDDNGWASHYLGYLADRPDSVSAALRVIAESRGAVIVHCAAGKDRTGTIVALALEVAGVSDEAITNDYLATGERIEGILARLRTQSSYDKNLGDRPVSEHLPDPEAMLRVLRAVRQQSGSVAGWLAEQGWSPQQIEALRSRLTTRGN